MSLIRPLGILTAIALALYLLVAWDPIGIYGDVRRYLEHPVNFPLEWTIALFVLAWIICRKEDYTIGAAALSVLFVIILTLSSPDYGAWFWRMFRHEIYLAPTYTPRGLVIYFFLFCFVVLTKVRLKQERKNTLLACLVIAFTLTSCEAVFAEPSIAVQYAGSGTSDSYGEPWREKAQEGWGAIIRLIDQYIPANYQHAAKIVASLYPFVAIVLLLFPGYRKFPKELLAESLARFWGTFPAFLFVGGLLGLSFWAHEAVIHLPKCPFSAACELKVLFLGFLSLPYLVFLAALVLTSVLWIPAVLLLLPAFILFALALPFKLVYLLLVVLIKAPLIIYHYLHYLFVPHPAETAYNAGMARHVPLPELAADVANAMYQYDMRDYDRLPRAWRSRNWQRRIEAFHNRIRAENDFMQELERNIRLREQRSMNRR